MPQGLIGRFRFCIDGPYISSTPDGLGCSHGIKLEGFLSQTFDKSLFLFNHEHLLALFMFSYFISSSFCLDKCLQSRTVGPRGFAITLDLRNGYAVCMRFSFLRAI